MLLRAKTGTATLIQFVVNTVLSFFGAVVAIIGGCFQNSAGACVTNAFVSLMLVLLVVVAYAFLVLIGYLAQERRDRRLAVLLIGFEAVACLVFLFDARQSPGFTDRLSNIAEFLVAAWVIFIAARQFLAKSGRIVHLPRK